MDWDKRARDFLDALEARTGFRWSGANPREGVKVFQRLTGLRDIDWKAGERETWPKLRELFPVGNAKPEPIALDGWVNCLPSWHGVQPVMSSGFVDHLGRGPNRNRFNETGRAHFGCDWEYWWNGKGEPPPGWAEYHFTNRRERMFYGPPTPVYAMGPGTVEYAKLLPISKKWGGPRWAVKIYHGFIEDFGYCVTWSTHHKNVHVAAGDTVAAGDVIATMGDTGCPGAPHVHQEIWRWQKEDETRTDLDENPRVDFAIDPYPLMKRFEIRTANS